MTNSNGNNGDRLDRIENILVNFATGLEEIKAITNSNSRAIQAMMEQQATDRLEHEERMRFLKENQRQLIQTQTGIANLVLSFTSPVIKRS